MMVVIRGGIIMCKCEYGSWYAYINPATNVPTDHRARRQKIDIEAISLQPTRFLFILSYLQGHAGFLHQIGRVKR
jgi:hypothetical protein